MAVRYAFASKFLMYNEGTAKQESSMIEAHGIKGLKSKPWRKTFKSQAAFEAWLEKNDGDVEVHGTREV